MSSILTCCQVYQLYWYINGILTNFPLKFRHMYGANSKATTYTVFCLYNVAKESLVGSNCLYIVIYLQLVEAQAALECKIRLCTYPVSRRLKSCAMPLKWAHMNIDQRLSSKLSFSYLVCRCSSPGEAAGS